MFVGGLLDAFSIFGQERAVKVSSNYHNLFGFCLFAVKCHLERRY